MDRTGIGLLLVCLLCVSTSVLGQNMVNVAATAPGRTCSQSSWHDSQADSCNAANGDTGETYIITGDSANCIHTFDGYSFSFGGYDQTPWWQVNLGRVYPVHDITVWGRGGYTQRLYPFTITVGDQLCARAASGGRQQSVKCASVLYGQVVRLTREWKQSDYTLNLCELQVYVPSGVSQCFAGRYGARCNSLCDNNCGGGNLKNFCNKDSGVCYGCVGNFTGDFCQDCKVGNYGTNCGSTCYFRCAGGCARDTGYCTRCVDGRWGSQFCQQTCPDNCNGNSCQLNNGHCYSCVDGRHGDRCDKLCTPSGCLRCEQNTGRCETCKANLNLAPPSCTDCADGFYKDNSNTCTRCSPNCKGNCNKVSGTCDNGCVDGLHGTRCYTPCTPSGCLRCEQNTGRCETCKANFNLVSPSCTECQAGSYRRFAYDQGCTRCTWTCYNNTSCDKSTGHCSRCQPGYKGNKCQTRCTYPKYGQECSQTCGQCRWNNACNYVDGHCINCQVGLQPPLCKEECSNGTYGNDCKNTCGQCKDNAACNNINGQCALCEPGWKTPTCQTPCGDGWYGDNCTAQCGTCDGGVACDKSTGYCPCPAGKQPPLCDTDCKDNKYGNDCLESCGQCQGEQPCNTVTGECPADCLPGWNGTRCDENCKNGTFGERCNKTCGNCEVNTTCHHVDGHCLANCASGFTGPSCLQAAAQSAGPASAAIAGAVVGVLAAIVVVVVVIVVVLIMRRRKRREKPDDQNRAGAEMTGSTDPLTTTHSADTNSPPQATTALSFAPGASMAMAAYANTKPQAEVKPTVKPGVKPKPHQPAKTNGAIYENVAISNKKPKPETNSEPKSANTKASPKLTGTKYEDAVKEKKGKPHVAIKPTEGRASREGTETPPEPLADDEVEDFGPTDTIYGNEQLYGNIKPTGIRLDKLQVTVVKRMSDGSLVEEFMRMIPNKDFSLKNGQRDENYYKNRFNSILPYDKNRVELEQVDGDDASDYVNASFVKGYKSEKAYIAAQGPKVNTQDDFWRMVWQEGVAHIVMLTNVKEGNKAKCYEYWPAQGDRLTTGHMEVTGVEEETRAHFVVRTFDLKKTEGSEKRRVKQYHYQSWRDHEVPATTPLVNFWRYVRSRAPRTAQAPPLVVHCSAGVGRTGTFIALDIIYDQAQQETEVNMYNTVDRLRDDRCHMVQNKNQYAFLHEAVVEAYMSGDSRIQMSDMDTVLPHAVTHHTPSDRVDREFQTLCKLRDSSTTPTYTTASLGENRAKNRNPKALPSDKHLVYLTQHVKGRNQYINAVYMPTFFQQRGSIMTQLPLQDTLVDFWRLVDGCDVNTIVSIGDVEGKKNMCRYWPKEGSSIKTGAYSITPKSTMNKGECLSSYTVEMKKDGTSREVRVLHYKDWTGQVADNMADLVHLLTTLHSSHDDRGGKPVIVQCLDGASQSGVVCALWDVISRMTCDAELDVYMAVRQLHTVRPEALTSVEQYRYCYEVAQHFKNSYNVYANT